MLLLARILSILSALVLGAHFMRSGSYELMAASILIAALVFVRRRWALYAVQSAMLLGAIEWGSTLLSIAAMRQAMGMPYGRMAAILGIVAAVCLAALVALTAPAVRSHFARRRAEPRIA